MDCLIAHVTTTHGLVRENVATEVLVYILGSLEPSIVRRVLKSYGMDDRWNSFGFRFELQRQASDERGIPDVQIRDANEELCALVESKFDARLTPHQPTDYLRSLPEGGLLLFIVPQRRQKELFRTLVDRCRASRCFRQVSAKDASLTCAAVDGKRVEVTSWEELLNRLVAALQHEDQSEKQDRRISDIEQLGRFCDMADRETFNPLTADQIRGSGISPVIHQLKWVTTALIRRAIERGIVAERNDSLRKGAKNTLQAGSDSSLFYGQNLCFCGADVWMGFWAEIWEARGTSPLWLWFERDPKSSEVANRILRMTCTPKSAHSRI